MSRRTRQVDRLIKEQDTVGAQREERKEQEELAGKKKVEGSLVKAQRLMQLEEKKKDVGTRPVRVARPGKPLKRP
jgi:hypothetical protein